MRFSFRPHNLSLYIAAALAVAGAGLAGCKSHETPAQQAQIQSEDDMASYQARIRKVVQDTDRANQLVATAADFQTLVQDSAATMKAYRARVALLNANYNATRADYEALFTQQDADQHAFAQRALAIRERMTELTTDSEWEQLKDVRVKTLDAQLQEMQY
jgi:hypothetical protein